MSEQMTPQQAFNAMSLFLERYYQRVGEPSELGAVLSDIQLLPDGSTADPAMWNDWLEAVRRSNQGERLSIRLAAIPGTTKKI
jgi:hypothetical protein